MLNTFVVCFKNRFRKRTTIIFIFALLLRSMLYLFIATKLELDTIKPTVALRFVLRKKLALILERARLRFPAAQPCLYQKICRSQHSYQQINTCIPQKYKEWPWNAKRACFVFLIFILSSLCMCRSERVNGAHDKFHISVEGAIKLAGSVFFLWVHVVLPVVSFCDCFLIFIRTPACRTSTSTFFPQLEQRWDCRE